MDRRRYLLAALLALLVLSVSAWTQVSRVQWEYRIEASLSQDKLNKLGADGWELITGGPTYFFKRPK
jgi:hypothetical protein